MSDQVIHIIYKTTNIITQEYYVGMHSTTNIDDGYLGSGTNIKKSVNVYGEDNHKRVILEFCTDRETLRKCEPKHINLDDPLILNIKPGGCGGWTIEQQKENNKKSQQKQRWLEQHDPVWVEQRSSTLSTARKLEYCEGTRISHVRPHILGEFNHSDETKLHLSNTKKGKNLKENNSAYGTCWIYSLVLQVNKRIHKSELPQYINDGWSKGRKIPF